MQEEVSTQLLSGPEVEALARGVQEEVSTQLLSGPAVEALARGVLGSSVGQTWQSRP